MSMRDWRALFGITHKNVEPELNGVIQFISNRIYRAFSWSQQLVVRRGSKRGEWKIESVRKPIRELQKRTLQAMPNI